MLQMFFPLLTIIPVHQFFVLITPYLQSFHIVCRPSSPSVYRCGARSPGRSCSPSWWSSRLAAIWSSFGSCWRTSECARWPTTSSSICRLPTRWCRRWTWFSTLSTWSTLTGRLGICTVRFRRPWRQRAYRHRCSLWWRSPTIGKYVFMLCSNSRHVRTAKQNDKIPNIPSGSDAHAHIVRNLFAPFMSNLFRVRGRRFL